MRQNIHLLNYLTVITFIYNIASGIDRKHDHMEIKMRLSKIEQSIHPPKPMECTKGK